MPTVDDPIVASHNAEALQTAAVAKEAEQKAQRAQMVDVVRQVIQETAPFASFEKIGEYIDSSVAKGISFNVNGKIDRMQAGLNEHNVKHEQDMDRMMPVILAFENGQRDLETAKKGGRVVLWIAGTITALGGAYLVLIQILASLKGH